QNQIVVVPGANAALAPADVLAARDLITQCDLLLCQLEVPLATVHEALRLARALGVRTLLNPAPALPLPDHLLPLAALCAPNETALDPLAGPAPSEIDAARRLRQRTGAVVVTLGGRGALLVDHDCHGVPTVPVQAVDPTA